MPKSYKVILSAEAGKNIEEAFHWIAEDDIKAAERWYATLRPRLLEIPRPLRG